MILYISYDGLCEPLGQSQVFQYIWRLATIHKRRFILLSFEKSNDLQDKNKINALKKKLKDVGVEWRPLRYHKRFSVLATAYDIFLGSIFSFYAVVFKKVKVIHARSYVSTLIAYFTNLILGTPFIFDMRGFWADEKVDVGSWPHGGLLYKATKFFEKKFLLRANSVVSLTHSAIEEMKRFSYLAGKDTSHFMVISTCVNLHLFSRKSGFLSLPKNNIDELIVGCIGGVRMWYDFELVLKCFCEIKIHYKNAKLLIVNKGEHEYIQQKLMEYGILKSSFELKSAEHQDIPREIERMHLTMFFINAFYSKIASAPTKLGEFLAMGVPCLTMGGVGDLERIVGREHVGVILSHKSPEGIAAAVENFLQLCCDEEISKRCVKVAEKYFSLSSACVDYDSIYKKLIGNYINTAP